MNQMLLIITPNSGWRREIMAFDLSDGSEAEIFQAFQAVNEIYDRKGERDSVNITLAHIGVDNLEAWLQNNVDPNWWERLWGRYRLSVTRLVRQNP